EQEPLGILGADAALGEMHMNDRDLDVRLCLLRNGEIGYETGAQEKNERGNGEPGVIDGIINEAGHVSARPDAGIKAAASLLRDRGQLVDPDRLDLLAFAHEILALHDYPRATGKTRHPHGRLLVLDDSDRCELNNVLGAHQAHAKLAI